MKLDSFNPSFDDLMTLDKRILWRAGDIWKTDNDGIPHSYRTMYGEKMTVKLPDNFPLKYKGRKVCGAVIWCNACELVTGVELKFTGGHVIAFDNPEAPTYRVVK